jgi:hypothetical protein
VCVALIVLWICGFWYLDAFEISTDSRLVHFYSRNGRLELWQFKPPQTKYTKDHLIMASQQNLWRTQALTSPELQDGFAAFEFRHRTQTQIASAPHWPFALLLGVITLAPWIKWGFSLRTLLIAVTVLAVVLGAVFRRSIAP